MDKKSIVRRVPIELELRIDDFRKKIFQKEGLVVSDTEAMRKFANEAITTYDEANEALKKMAKYKLIK